MTLIKGKICRLSQGKKESKQSNSQKMCQNVGKKISYSVEYQTVLPDGNGGFAPCPVLLTEDELIRFLRIPEISKAQDFHNVIENLKRMHGLPRIRICSKTLFPLEAVKKWLEERVVS